LDRDFWAILRYLPNFGNRSSLFLLGVSIKIKD